MPGSACSFQDRTFVNVSGKSASGKIASRYAAGIDERPWNALYERPQHWPFYPMSATRMFLTPAVGLAGTQIGWPAVERALSLSIVASAWSDWLKSD